MDEVDELKAEVARLRARTHEIQEEESRRRADLQRRVHRFEHAMEEARERVKDIPADWTTDPPSQEEHGLWRYTSANTAHALTRLALDKQDAEAELERVRAVAREVVKAWRQGWPTGTGASLKALEQVTGP